MLERISRRMTATERLVVLVGVLLITAMLGTRALERLVPPPAVPVQVTVHSATSPE